MPPPEVPNNLHSFVAVGLAMFTSICQDFGRTGPVSLLGNTAETRI